MIHLKRGQQVPEESSLLDSWPLHQWTLPYLKPARPQASQRSGTRSSGTSPESGKVGLEGHRRGKQRGGGGPTPLSPSLVQTWDCLVIKLFYICFHLYFTNSKSCFEEYLLFLNWHIQKRFQYRILGSLSCLQPQKKQQKYARGPPLTEPKVSVLKPKPVSKVKRS